MHYKEEAASNNQASSENDNSPSGNQDRDVDRKALEIILSNVQTSPYLSEEDFQNVVLEVLDFSSSSRFLSAEVSNAMAEAILNRNWEGLLSIASSSPDSNIEDLLDPSDTSEEMRLRNFRDMVIQILLTSRKIGKMSVFSRRRYGDKIHSASSISEIKGILTGIIGRSGFLRLGLEERESVKSHISSGRFDLLLLPKSFDCDEKPRKAARPGMTRYGDEEQGQQLGEDSYGSYGEFEECVICLSVIEEEGQMLMLECNHWYCRECISSWVESNPTCPTCRAPVSATLLSSMRRTNYGSVAIASNISGRTPQNHQSLQARSQSQNERRPWNSHSVTIVIFVIFEISTNLYVMSVFGAASILIAIFIILGMFYHWLRTSDAGIFLPYPHSCPLHRFTYAFASMFILGSIILFLTCYYHLCYNEEEHYCLGLVPGVQYRINAFLLLTVITIMMMVHRYHTDDEPPTTLLGEIGLLHITYISRIVYVLEGAWIILSISLLIFVILYACYTYPVVQILLVTPIVIFTVAFLLCLPCLRLIEYG